MWTIAPEIKRSTLRHYAHDFDNVMLRRRSRPGLSRQKLYENELGRSLTADEIFKSTSLECIGEVQRTLVRELACKDRGVALVYLHDLVPSASSQERQLFLEQLPKKTNECAQQSRVPALCGFTGAGLEWHRARAFSSRCARRIWRMRPYVRTLLWLSATGIDLHHETSKLQPPSALERESSPASRNLASDLSLAGSAMRRFSDNLSEGFADFVKAEETARQDP